MKKKKSQRVAASDAKEPSSSFAEQMQAQREKLFEAMNIVEACRMGNDSMLATMLGDDEPEFCCALAAVWRMINEVAEAMDTLAKTAPRAAPS